MTFERDECEGVCTNSAKKNPQEQFLGVIWFEHGLSRGEIYNIPKYCPSNMALSIELIRDSVTSSIWFVGADWKY